MPRSARGRARRGAPGASAGPASFHPPQIKRDPEDDRERGEREPGERVFAVPLDAGIGVFAHGREARTGSIGADDDWEDLDAGLSAIAFEVEVLPHVSGNGLGRELEITA